MAISKIDPAGLDVGQIGGRRNLIINGAMQVAQRGTSFTGVTGSIFTLDRWTLSGNTEDTATITQESDAPEGFKYSYKFEVTTADATVSADDYLSIRTDLEVQDLQHLKYGTSNAENVTLSFWVKSSVTGTFTAALDYANTAGTYYNGNQYTINSANTWEYKTIVIDGYTAAHGFTNADNGTGCRVWFNMTVGSNYTSNSGTTGEWGTGATSSWGLGHTADIAGTLNATFQITGVQLEVGSVATPFEHRSYGEELALCQRYYQKSYNTTTVPGTSTQQGAIYSRHTSGATVGNRPTPVSFAVTMRDEPAIVLYSLVGTSGKVSDCATDFNHSADVTGSVYGGQGVTGFSKISTAGLDDILGMHYTADAEL